MITRAGVSIVSLVIAAVRGMHSITEGLGGGQQVAVPAIQSPASSRLPTLQLRCPRSPWLRPAAGPQLPRPTASHVGWLKDSGNRWTVKSATARRRDTQAGRGAPRSLCSHGLTLHRIKGPPVGVPASREGERWSASLV